MTSETAKYITLRIPVIDTGDTAEQKRRKMMEEIDELMNEYGVGNVDIRAAMEEFFDVAQVMVGFLLAHEKDVQIEAAVSWVNMQMQMANARHETKMHGRAKERGWKVI